MRPSKLSVILLAVVATGASLGIAADRDRSASGPDEPALHEAYYVASGQFRVLVPGNWTWRESATGSSDPRAAVRSITLDPGEGGVLRLAQYTTDQTADERLEATIGRYLEGSEELARAPYTDWGRIEGSGAVVRYRDAAGETHRLRVVVDRADDGRVFEVHVLATDDTTETLDKGFIFIERTLEID